MLWCTRGFKRVAQIVACCRQVCPAVFLPCVPASLCGAAAGRSMAANCTISWLRLVLRFVLLAVSMLQVVKRGNVADRTVLPPVTPQNAGGTEYCNPVDSTGRKSSHGSMSSQDAVVVSTSPANATKQKKVDVVHSARTPLLVNGAPRSKAAQPCSATACLLRLFCFRRHSGS
jgi:hypothetical protein